MCGIAGILDFQRPPPAAALDGMLRSIVHRGPDDEGRRASGPCALGMRRLSIIDLDGGHQPIANEDETIWVVFNGEIYNYIELRADLESRGHRFRTRTDTEVLVHAYEAFGDDFPSRLNGMFAFALWDERRERLLLVRDQMGIKPLYWREHCGRLTFASELKCFRFAEPQDWDLNRNALAAYLHLGYIPRGCTPIEGIAKLGAGQRLVLERGQRPRVDAYWRLADAYAAPRRSPDAAFLEEAGALLDDAIRLQLRSDVPVGCFLSGGLDSSAITVSAARRLPAIDTFGVGFSGHYFDEMPYARAVAAHAGARHHEQVLEPGSLPDELARLAWYLDEPNSDPALVPSYLICRYAREFVKVALSGAGGDELFAGYPRHVDPPPSSSRADRFRRIAPRGLRRALAGALPLTAAQRERMSAENHVLGMSYWVDHLADPVLHPAVPWAAEFSAIAWIEQVYAEAKQADAIGARCYYDATTYLPDQILAMTDRASMAVSLEVRVPLLDVRLVELMARLPGAAHTAQGGKTVLKKLVRDRLPPEVVDRRKLGFGLPVVRWIRDPAVADRLRAVVDGPLVARGLVDRTAWLRLLDRPELVEGRWPFFWNVLMLDLWCAALGPGAATRRT